MDNLSSKPKISFQVISSLDMIRTLSKPRSKSNLITIHMKFILLVIIGALLWNNNDARQFTSDQLQSMSEFIQPNQQREIKLSFWFMTQTYKQLLDTLLTLTPEQLDCTPTVYDPDTDEYYPVTTFLTASETNQVLDESHPYLSFWTMTQTKDNIIDRDQLQEEYILRVIDSMDYKDIERFVFDTINKNLDDYTVDELIYEVSESYPDLLDDTDEDDLPEPDESTGWN